MDVALEIIDASLEALLNEPLDPLSTGREFLRVPFRGRAAAVIFPAPNSASSFPFKSEVLTTDISRGGLSLLHRRELHHGQRVLLELSLVHCTVEVCWCCLVWEGLYVAGCRFVDNVYTDTLAAALNGPRADDPIHRTLDLDPSQLLFASLTE